MLLIFDHSKINDRERVKNENLEIPSLEGADRDRLEGPLTARERENAKTRPSWVPK